MFLYNNYGFNGSVLPNYSVEECVDCSGQCPIEHVFVV